MWCNHHGKQGLCGSWVMEEGQSSTNAGAFTLIVTLGGHRLRAGMIPTGCGLENGIFPVWLGWFTIACPGSYKNRRRRYLRWQVGRPIQLSTGIYSIRVSQFKMHIFYYRLAIRTRYFSCLLHALVQWIGASLTLLYWESLRCPGPSQFAVRTGLNFNTLTNQGY